MRVDAGALASNERTRIVLMNEVGARRFDLYEDSDGALLGGREIETWRRVQADGPPSGTEAGCLFLRAGETGRRLFRGRELVGQAVLGGIRLRPPAGSGEVRVRDRNGGERMTSVLLIYPFFKPRHDNSEFRFPPLGLGYIAASLREAGHEVSLLDCTFLGRGGPSRRPRPQRKWSASIR